MKNIPVYFSDNIECTNCKSSIRVQSLIKLKDRYCCPNCFSTLKITKRKESDKNGK